MKTDYSRTFLIMTSVINIAMQYDGKGLNIVPNLYFWHDDKMSLSVSVANPKDKKWHLVELKSLEKDWVLAFLDEIEETAEEFSEK